MKLSELKNEKSEREKVSLWLDHIVEHDPVCRAEVLEHCASDKPARMYYLRRYAEDCDNNLRI